MTTTYNLRAATNVSFRLTLDLSSLSGVYDIAASVIRMQARMTAASADPPVYEWCSSNSQGGLVSFDAASSLCIFSAPESAMEQMPDRLVHDCRLELTSGAVIPLFAGRLVFVRGITRTASASTTDGNLRPHGYGHGRRAGLRRARAAAPVALVGSGDRARRRNVCASVG